MSTIEGLIKHVSQDAQVRGKEHRFIGIVAAYIFHEPGGFAGFQEKFRRVGLGGVFDSWIGFRKDVRSVTVQQIRSALGDRDILRIAERSGVHSSAIGASLAFALPEIVRGITPSGALPMGMPNELAGLSSAYAGEGANGSLQAGTRRSAAWWRWLPPLLVLLTVGYCVWLAGIQGHSAPTSSYGRAKLALSTDAAPRPEPRFSLSNEGGKVAVDGLLTTEEQKAKLWNALVATFGEDNVQGNIRVNSRTQAAGWYDRIRAMIPSLKSSGLKFGFEGDRVVLDTSALRDEERVATSALFQNQLSEVEVEGLYDEGVEALNRLGDQRNVEQVAAALSQTRLRFKSDSALLTRSSSGIIREVADAINRTPVATRFEIGGHTDEQGSPERNVVLSTLRAEAVMSALIARGVPSDRLLARGYGSTQPLRDNSTFVGRSANQRIGYTVVPTLVSSM